jgi:hypothetical protein
MLDPNEGIPKLSCRYLTDPPNKKGQPRYLIDRHASSEFLRDHFGITSNLDSPVDLWVRGTITKNAYHYPNGVTVLNIPEGLYKRSTRNQLGSLDYANNPYVRGGVQGAKSFYPPWFDIVDTQNMLWKLQRHPSTVVSGKIIQSQSICWKGEYFFMQAQGYGTQGIMSVFPTINQPGPKTLGIPDWFAKP